MCRSCRLLALVLFATGLSAVPAAAQTTTGTIRGYVTAAAGGPVTGADLVAKDVATGLERRAASRADGGYTLPGLAPGVYELTCRSVGYRLQARRVQVLIGATQLVDFALEAGAVELEAITVEAAPIETRTSEVATNVTPQQMARLPTAGRNFLDLAVLAPGVTASEDRVNFVGARTFAAGGQSPNQGNVFIDGTSLKNDLTAGGVTGQDASRGNPFPRNAIQEYRIISQNFKAEYQRASSGVITATTRSGGNRWTGNLLITYQNKDLFVLDTFQIRDKHIADSIARVTGTPSTFREPDYTRVIPAVSVGGPLIRDRLFLFAAYEGNYQNRSNRVAFTPPPGLPALDTVTLTQYNGNFTSPFRETLLFGKLTYAVNSNSSAELSFSNRHETDVRDFGVNRAFERAVNFRQNVTIAQLRYNRFSGAWLNAAKIDYSRFRRNPAPASPGRVARDYHYPGQDALIGSDLSTQDFIQRRIGFRDDLTFSGVEGHVFKGGASVDFVTYDITKENNGTPRFEYAQYVDPVTYNWTTNTSGLPFNFRNPFKLTYSTGAGLLNTNNTQVGIYVQDDWTPTPRLTLNLGVRWDFESRVLNTDYVTPQIVVDTLTRYNDSLPTPLDLSRYISTGNNRKPFYGAIQPRIGFSYALDDDNRTTIFGGVGIYYDRSIFDFSVDEIQKLARPDYTVQFAHPDSTPGPGQVAWSDTYLTTDTAVLNSLVRSVGQPEAFLLDNKMRPPRSTQWSLGVRRVLGSWVGSITYQGQRGTDFFTYNWANFGLDTAGRCCTSFNIGAHGFRNIIYSTNDGKTWYDALSFQLDRPYRRSSETFGWGGGLVYTYARRSIAGVDNLNDITSSFPGAFPNTRGIPKHSDNGGNDERHRVVANWTMDVPYAFGIEFSGLVVLSSGARLDVGCPARFCGPATYINGGFVPTEYHFFVFGGWAYRRVDIKFRKDFPQFGGTQLGVTVDVFNVFNYQNFGCYDVGFASANFGKANCLVSDPRRVQIGAEYTF